MLVAPRPGSVIMWAAIHIYVYIQAETTNVHAGRWSTHASHFDCFVTHRHIYVISQVLGVQSLHTAAVLNGRSLILRSKLSSHLIGKKALRSTCTRCCTNGLAMRSVKKHMGQMMLLFICLLACRARTLLGSLQSCLLAHLLMLTCFAYACLVRLSIS